EPSEEERRPQIVDERAPRIELSIDKFVDASAPNHIVMTFRAKNTGERPMFVVLRPRMLGLNVDGPDGFKRCEAQPSTGAVPRDAFRTLKPGDTVTMSLLLGEICPLDVFSRPGLYKVQATLDANESGAEIGLSAYTGESISEHGWLRLATGSEPFYATAPRAKKTATLVDEDKD
ncbi:MAG TPA: hypothetical protein VHB21_17360, partial [Minicystis sp.]|nr:hypothetical protein [Minicystis sp.]